MADTRADTTHQITTELTRSYSLIGIEGLDVQDMMSNHNLARSVADMSFHEFRRQLEYKAAATGACIVVADRWFASSKTCNVCGWKKEGLELYDRKWKCEGCGVYHDRDVNAAINLRNYAVSVANKNNTPGVTRGQPVESSCVGYSMKQELNIRFD